MIWQITKQNELRKLRNWTVNPRVQALEQQVHLQRDPRLNFQSRTTTSSDSRDTTVGSSTTVGSNTTTTTTTTCQNTTRRSTSVETSPGGTRSRHLSYKEMMAQQQSQQGTQQQSQQGTRQKRRRRYVDYHKRPNKRISPALAKAKEVTSSKFGAPN